VTYLNWRSRVVLTGTFDGKKCDVVFYGVTITETRDTGWRLAVIRQLHPVSLDFDSARHELPPERIVKERYSWL